jgi:hypothetical protein
MKTKIIIRRKLHIVGTLLALLYLDQLAGAVAHAAPITWGAATTIAGTNDIYVVGTARYAYDWGTTQTVNGVTFAATTITNAPNGTTSDGNLSVSGFTKGNPTAFGSGSNPFAALVAVYTNMLRGGAFTIGGGTPVTVTLSNLAIGSSYMMQVWISDPRGASNQGLNRNSTITNAGGNSITLMYNTTGVEGGIGQFALGTFIADSTNQSFTITGGLNFPGTNTASSQINAIQLRDVTGAPLTTPALSLAAGSYFGAQIVTVSSEVGSTVFYTTNGSTPTSSSPSGANGSGFATVNLPVGATMTINAFATNALRTDSAVASATYTTLGGTSGEWTNPAGGSWTNVMNWANNAVVSGTNIIADFSELTLTSNINVTLDSSKAIGGLWFDDQSSTKYRWTLENSTVSSLTLAVSSGSPVISNNVQATISTAALNGSQGFTKTGTGTLGIGTSTSHITGNINIEIGVLQLGATAGAQLTSATNVLGTTNSGSGTPTLRVGLSNIGTTVAENSPIIVSSNAPSAKLFLDNNPASTAGCLVSGAITLQHDLWITNSCINSGAIPQVNGQISGSGDLHFDTVSYGTRWRLNYNGNNFTGNIYIHSGGLQTGDSSPGTMNVIPDNSDVTIYGGGTLGIGKSDTMGSLNGDAGAVLGENVTAATNLTLTLGNNNHSGIFNGTIFSADVGGGSPGRDLQITKIGSGTQTFNGTCSNTAPTYIGGGTLIINSNYASAITVSNGATLGGHGTLFSNVTVQAGGALSPGTSIGTLTINSNLMLAGNLYIEVNKALSPAQTNDQLIVGGALTNSGTGTVTMTNLDLARPFVAGDKFTLFSQPLSNGLAMTISPATPGANLAWTNNLAVDGSIGVYSTSGVNTTPTKITVSISGSTLTLSWPADHLGWHLQAQTNALGTGLKSNGWVVIPGTDLVTSTNINITKTNPTVFYQMTYP